jgi:hypothetical protein
MFLLKLCAELMASTDVEFNQLIERCNEIKSELIKLQRNATLNVESKLSPSHEKENRELVAELAKKVETLRANDYFTAMFKSNMVSSYALLY